MPQQSRQEKKDWTHNFSPNQLIGLGVLALVISAALTYTTLTIDPPEKQVKAGTVGINRATNLIKTVVFPGLFAAMMFMVGCARKKEAQQATVSGVTALQPQPSNGANADNKDIIKPKAD